MLFRSGQTANTAPLVKRAGSITPHLPLIVGEKEQENNEISIRKQGEGDQGTMKIATFAAQITAEVGDMMNRWKKKQRN